MTPYPHVDDRAPCRHGDPNRWWPTRLTNRAILQPVLDECARCPFLAPCRRWAVLHEMDGVWGGTTPKDRKKIRKHLGLVCLTPYMSVEGRIGDRHRPRPDHHQCGSIAGYSLHRRHREPVCAACQEAQRDWSARHRKGRSA